MTNAEDVQIWLADPVTKKFFQEIDNRREEVKELLIRQAGLDPINDAYYRGYAVACLDILATEFEGDNE